MQNQSLVQSLITIHSITKTETGERYTGDATKMQNRTLHKAKQHTLITLNNRTTHKKTKHYYEPLDHYSSATVPNLIEVVLESNKH